MVAKPVEGIFSGTSLLDKLKQLRKTRKMETDLGMPELRKLAINVSATAPEPMDQGQPLVLESHPIRAHSQDLPSVHWAADLEEAFDGHAHLPGAVPAPAKPILKRSLAFSESHGAQNEAHHGKEHGLGFFGNVNVFKKAKGPLLPQKRTRVAAFALM